MAANLNNMKKLLLLTVAVLAAMAGCKNKGESAPADSNDSTIAVIDSIIEENDTTPLPMFLIGSDGKYMQMLYWTNIEEPKKDDDNAEYFETWHNNWELQDMFRRNAAQYTNLLQSDKIVKLKFIDEVLKDPDGNTPSIEEIHSREGIPSLCARFDYADAKDKKVKSDDEFVIDSWGMVITTDSYLKSRKHLDIKPCTDGSDTIPPLPANIVKQLEKAYGMVAVTSKKHSIIDNRYIHGTVEFKGEYKDAPKDKYDADRKHALALELLIDGDKIYKLEQLGYYDPEWGTAWNADADGYIPNSIVAAFEGPKGLELCYTHAAPESFAIGMLFPRDDKLVELEYGIFHCMIDEETPVWKKDLAEMQKLYDADETVDYEVKFTKWAHCYIDYTNEWIWLRDKDDQDGAFFIRQDDGKFKLIAVETPKMKPSRMEGNGTFYLKIAGSAGGPSWAQEIYAFRNGKLVEKFNVIEVEGNIDGCSLNGKDISAEQGRAYLDKLPEAKEITAFFRDYEQ